MTDLAQQELACAIVHDAVRKYIATRRERIDPFIDRHFTLAGSLALHRQAIGWDLLRAPANLFLAGPALSVKLASWAARRAGNHRLAAWLGGRRLLVETDVAREVEWLVATELLESPCRRRDRASYRDVIAETILADSRAAERLGAQLNRLAGRDPECRGRVVLAIENYLGLRNATVEIATGFFAALAELPPTGDQVALFRPRLGRLERTCINCWRALPGDVRGDGSPERRHGADVGKPRDLDQRRLTPRRNHRASRLQAPPPNAAT
jgi:hypothetical protein